MMTAGDTLHEAVTFLQDHNVRCSLWSSEDRWVKPEDYTTRHQVLMNDLMFFTSGNSGMEKIMFTNPELFWVVKTAGDPETQHTDDGIQSLFEETHTYLNGWGEHKNVMAATLLLKHHTGLPFVVQEKLTNLTTRVPAPVAETLNWLPAAWRSYAQIGLNHDNRWCFYDLDAGSTYMGKESYNTFLNLYYQDSQI